MFIAILSLKKHFDRILIFSSCSRSIGLRQDYAAEVHRRQAEARPRVGRRLRGAPGVRVNLGGPGIPRGLHASGDGPLRGVQHLGDADLLRQGVRTHAGKIQRFDLVTA